MIFSHKRSILVCKTKLKFSHKSLEKRRAIEFFPNLRIGAVRNEPQSAEVIFAWKRIILKHFENSGGFDHFWGDRVVGKV